jgi:hypothetical protein
MKKILNLISIIGIITVTSCNGGCNRADSTFFSDSFSGNLDPTYRKFDERNTDEYEVVSGRLRITASRGEDLWGGSPLKRGAPLLLHTTPAGEYSVESFVEFFDPNNPAEANIPRYNTQAGLFVFEDVENWLFFGFTFHRSQGGTLPDGNGLIITSTIGDASNIEHYENFGPPLIGTLKIEKSGNFWRFYIKAGSSWNQVGSPAQAPFGNHEVGMGAKSFQTGGTVGRGYFDNFIIRN